ncbi:hypothetical protein DL95DRAFT_407807 [Leptodontidium sp. 2 PMI_412]|nr:hypothetical protein DL95DRAFT_407807 [Leptodontidium sp. 2 PMI_412]
MTTSTLSIETAANEFIKSYASAVSLETYSPPTSLDAMAPKLAKHYLPNFTFFSPGHVRPSPTQATTETIIKEHIQRYIKSGVGLDLREAGSRVHVMSEGSAVCWMRFKIVPDPEWKGGVHGEGKGGWEWENCYFYRRT